MDRRLKADPTDWLLTEGQPWVRYRAMVDLLDKPEGDPEVKEARQEMLEHPQVQGLIEELKEWPGYPLKRHNDAKHPFHKLAILADFGFRASDPAMPWIIKKVMAHQSSEGAFQVTAQIDPRYGGTGEIEWTWMLCDAPTTLYALLAFGLGENEAVRGSVHHLTGLIRDNGWPCASQTGFRGPGRKDDPCPLANLLGLKALAQVPEMRDGEAAHIGAEMLLDRWEHQKERKIYLFGMGTDFRKLKYPFIWYDILHVTDVLSRFPFLKNDPRLQEMVETLVAQQDGQGRFAASSIWMTWRGWGFGQKKEPSPWITLLALRVIKRLYG
ncbi:MAG: hypothetical protein ACE5II_00870 [Anaerolineae bacterium]